MIYVYLFTRTRDKIASLDLEDAFMAGGVGLILHLLRYEYDFFIYRKADRYFGVLGCITGLALFLCGVVDSVSKEKTEAN